MICVIGQVLQVVPSGHSAWPALGKRMRNRNILFGIVLGWLNEQEINYTVRYLELSAPIGVYGLSKDVRHLLVSVELGERDAIVLKIAVPEVMIEPEDE